MSKTHSLNDPAINMHPIFPRMIEIYQKPVLVSSMKPLKREPVQRVGKRIRRRDRTNALSDEQIKAWVLILGLPEKSTPSLLFGDNDETFRMDITNLKEVCTDAQHHGKDEDQCSDEFTEFWSQYMERKALARKREEMYVD